MASMPTDTQSTTSELLSHYVSVRRFSQLLCEPLEIEDFVVQSMPDASPIRWHLAHTTWFFETFVLRPFAPNYQPIEPLYEYLFNSYYNGVGQQFPRAKRGLLTRPSVADIYLYRQTVDNQIQRLISQADDPLLQEITPLVELGLQHEQQHQELMLTDLKHVFAQNPLYPIYQEVPRIEPPLVPEQTWHRFEGGVVEIGHAGESFAYDNETPRHEALIHPFEIAGRLVTNVEMLEFMEDGGYHRPELWLSLGWNQLQTGDWSSPLYWVHEEDGWYEFTLGGLVPLSMAAPVTHISYFEADAFARWKECRLPTEFEWELASQSVPIEGNFVSSHHFHPASAQTSDGLRQMFGDTWQWTASPYAPYPGYRPAEGAIGEYNGKFMCNQYVLRGGSCATSRSHIRRTYRNFFPPEARWQFTGIRLAR
ncbi:ergothioneine biosynthesis protein EgtB [bacterium]|nr:ergothioneine biosynthesis protein EgtB [bacterium]